VFRAGSDPWSSERDLRHLRASEAEQKAIYADCAELNKTEGVAGPTGERATGELARYALSGPLSGFDAVLVELNFAPGASAPVHRHPGPILGYVVDGSLPTAINDEPGAVVPAGGTFFEPTGAVHTTFGAATAEAPVRSVVFLVVPNGSGVTERVTSVP
jgi:quercetin dioxygenase-like cupin family protein